jgi:RNA polymerase sigma factor (sigma-70 family)
MNVSDSELVRQTLAGEKAAFGGLVERHRPMAVRLATRMLCDRAEADDVTQEACLQAFFSLQRLQAPERFGAWLYGIVVNLCRMRLRARRATYTLEDWDGGRVAPNFRASEAQLSPEAIYEIQEVHLRLLQAIELLPDEQRAAVRWHYLDGLSLAEIAALSRTPLGTVKARLHRAREKLRAELIQAEPARINSPRKEQPIMIEVLVQSVMMRVGQPKADVIEAGSRERPGPDAPELRLPLPSLPLGAAGMFIVRGDEQNAQVGNLFNIPLPAPGPQRVVILKEKNGERLLPIWIGPYEADMITLQLAGNAAPRPMTYELAARLLEAAQASIERVAISKLHEQVFYATLWVKSGDSLQELDARPSDALNLALRANAPIFVAPDIMEAQAVLPDKLEGKLEESSEQMTFKWVSAPAPDMTWPKK